MKTIRRAVLAAVILVVSTSAFAQPAFNEDYFTTSNGVKIHYLMAGTSGSWVVLIHGYSDNAERMWFRTGIAPAIAKNHRIVALDNRNHGKSDKPQPGGSGKAQDTAGFGGSDIQETDAKLRAQAEAMGETLPKAQGEDAAAMDRFRSRVAQSRPASSAP